MRIGTLSAFVAIAILGLVAWMLLRVAPEPKKDPCDRVAVATHTDDSRASDVSRTPAATVTPPANPSLEPARIAEEVGVARKTREAARDEAASSDAGTVEGKVVIVDRDGHEEAAANGSFHAAVSTSAQEVERIDRVPFTAGSFRLRLSPGVTHRMEIFAFTVEPDGRFAEAEKRQVDLVAGQSITLRARRESPVELEVVDARTGEELHGVMVLRVRDKFGPVAGGTHPGAVSNAELLGQAEAPNYSEVLNDRERAHDLLVANAKSPVVLHAKCDGGGMRIEWRSRLYVSAPGHAWATIAVDFRLGGATKIALEPGVDLDVTTAVPDGDHWLWSQLPPRIRIFKAKPDARVPEVETLVGEQMKQYAAMSDGELRAETPEGRRPTEAEVRTDVSNHFDELRRKQICGAFVTDLIADLDEPTHVRGLEPGRYFVTLQKNASSRHPRVFDETTIDLSAGKTALTLTIPFEAEKERVRIAGTVHVSSDWKRGSLRLDFDPASVAGATETDERSLLLSDLTQVAGTPDLYRFEVGGILPGRYSVTSSSFDWHQKIDTGLAGRDDIAIVIPDPADVLVHLVDDETGNLILGPKSLTTHSNRPLDGRDDFFRTGRWDKSSMAYRLRVPAGEVELNEGGLLEDQFDDQFEATGTTRVTVQPGPNDVTLRVRRSTVIALSLMCEGELVEPWAIFTQVEVARLDAPKPACRPNSCTQSQILVRVPAAGRYHVTIAAIAGYADVPPLIVTAREGERTDCKIELFRTR